MLENTLGGMPAGEQPGSRHRILFAYWGRRGALARLMLDLTKTACASPELRPLISVSRQNELFTEFAAFAPNILAVDTFTSRLGAANPARLIHLRSKIRAAIHARGIETVVLMMPHVWGPAIMPGVRRSGCRYALVVHDGGPHPGDPTTALNTWMLRDAASADCVVTLSKAVAQRLTATCEIPEQKLVSLFHPELSYGQPMAPVFPHRGQPLRLLFFGRILPYKGLPIFVEAVERLRAEGVPLEVGIFGEGDVNSVAERLQILGAEVVNRWIPDRDVAQIFARHDAVVLAHTEASQSGIIATAHGLG